MGYITNVFTGAAPENFSFRWASASRSLYATIVTANMKNRFGRFSIGSLLLVTALIAMAISHGRTSLRLYWAEEKLIWLERARDDLWPNPSVINAISVSSPPTDEDRARKKIQMEWKIMLPIDAKYRVRFETSNHMNIGVGNSNRSTNLRIEDADLKAGVSMLSISIFENADGRLILRTQNAGKSNDVEIEEPLDLFAWKSTITHYSGSDRTESAATIGPFLLAYIGEYVAPGKPAPGIKMWIEQVPMKSTEPTDTPKSSVDRPASR